MSRRPVTHHRAEDSKRNASAGIARAHLFDVVDRHKRIDHYIDYFGSDGVGRPVTTSDRRGESLLDAGGPR